jgi:SAM-dependent methyltransferase
VRNDRPTVDHRATYEPTAPQEAFIVPLVRAHVEATLGSLDPAVPGGRSLDVGCGRQPFRTQIEALGYEYVGLDIRQNLERTVRVIAEIDRPLPNVDALERPFELVVCLEVLEHVADWTAAFANLTRLVATDGCLVVTCPHFYQLHEEPYDFWRPTIHALRYYAESAGFRAVSLVAAGDAWDVLGTALANSSPARGNRTAPSRAAARCASWALPLIVRALATGRQRRWVRLNGPLYLSNIGVFTKVPPPEAVPESQP